jgi:hypothetical protein
MDTESAPNDLLMLEGSPIHIDGLVSIHFATAWWMPAPESQDPAIQARAFAKMRTEVRSVRCVNEWSIE